MMTLLGKKVIKAICAGARLMRHAPPPPLKSEDAVIRARFNDWLAILRRAHSPAADEQRLAQYRIAWDLETEIAAMPAEGPIGLALKSFLLMHTIIPPGYGEDPCALGKCCYIGDVAESLFTGILGDVVRALPEIADLCAHAFEPAAESDDDEEDDDAAERRRGR
jgi:hypothetical protein